MYLYTEVIINHKEKRYFINCTKIGGTENYCVNNKPEPER